MLCTDLFISFWVFHWRCVRDFNIDGERISSDGVQPRRYGARLGFSAGPGSVWKISALLNASVDDDQFDYPHSDMRLA